MMGALLTQPQRMRRARVTDPGISLASDVTNLAARLAQDTEQGGRIAEVAGQAFEDALRAFVEARKHKFETVGPRLASWLLRVLRATTGLGPDLQVGSPADALELMQRIVQSFAQATQNTNSARIRPYVAELLDIVQVELSLSLPALETALWDAVEVVLDRLEALPPEAQRAARENRLDVIRMLRRIRKLIRGKFPLPVLDADRIAAGLAATLQRIDAAKLGRAAQCAADGMGKVAEAGRAIDGIVPLGSLGGFRNLGAAAAVAEGETYCWYASWLFGADVVINKARTEIRRGDAVVKTGTDLSIANIPEFEPTASPRYTFGNTLTLQTMETTTFAFYIIADGIVILCHLISLENGDFASNGFNAGLTTFMVVGKPLFRSPVASSGVEDWVMPLIGSFLGSFQGIHTKCTFGNGFFMWVTLFLPDFIEAVIYKQASIIARDLFLSLFTLIINDGGVGAEGDPDTRALGRKHLDGVVWIFEFLGSTVFFKLYPREEYMHPFHSGKHFAKQFLFWDLFLNNLFYVMGRLIGCIVASGIAGTTDFDTWVKPLPLKLLLLNPVTFFVSLYRDKEGDTDDGKYNPSGGAAYAGYPDKATSPYTLPFLKDQTYYCVQGNQGLFSHYHENVEQTYSFDLSMDQGDIILAARPGTVVDYFDWVPDNTNPDATEMAAAKTEAQGSRFLHTTQTDEDGWNFIIIRHDVDDAGNALAPDNTHDKAAGGTVVTTYGVYGHGRKDSVRAAFDHRGIAPNTIIGQKVKRGQRIMQSGDTGVSFNNHLHIHVQEGPATAATPPAVKRSTLPAPTLPFVFKDIGRLKALDWYTSEIEEVS